ncbi:M23 family metallopeptidase [Frigoribacterium sp. 2-23]|uniref:M23 family metallopeptidase n=1 Tax=Frigoribacterium sp. 2-23 TaxID=3415006 RepID=UPI003C6F9C64
MPPASLTSIPRPATLAGLCLAIVLAAVSGAAPAASAVPPAPRTSATWSWPTGAPVTVERAFVKPEHAWSPGHRGVDLAYGAGSPVLAPDDGVVHFSGVVVDRPVLSIAHDGGVLSSYEPVTSDLTRGTPVTRGQVVGVLRPGHRVDADCLHLGARVDGEYVSPLLFLGRARPSVLLPTRALPR